MSNSYGLLEKFAIDDQNLRQRRAFIRLGDAEQRILVRLIPWAEKHAESIATAFYDWQFDFPSTRSFFERYGAAKGITLSALRGHLERAQAGYLKGVFTGAQENWGKDYFAFRLNIGRVHDQINLPLKWYMGSYTEHQILIGRALRRAYWWSPRFVHRAEVAISKVFNYDMQAVAESYILSVFDSLGVDLDAVACRPGEDRGEHIGEIKESVRAVLSQVAISLVDLNEASQTLTAVSTQMANDADQTSSQAIAVSAATEEMSISVKEIAKNAAEAANVAVRGVEVAATTNGAIAKLEESSSEIGSVVKLIASVAEQTNLLALNATIEAARAGEAGKGFAVVANEVKELAKQTAHATQSISDRIALIQERTQESIKAIAQISGIVGQIRDLQNATASAVEQQAATTNEIATRTSGVTEAAQRTAGESNHIKEAAGALATMAQELQSLVANFKFDDLPKRAAAQQTAVVLRDASVQRFNGAHRRRRNFTLQAH